MKTLLATLILLSSSLSFAAHLPPCASGQYDKWGYCADDSRTGQLKNYYGASYCLNPCNEAIESLIEKAQAATQKNANSDRMCGFYNVLNSAWKAPVITELVEGERSWVKVTSSAQFKCERY